LIAGKERMIPVQQRCSHLELVNLYSLLCGLPEEKARECLLVPVKAFIDDAGVKNTDEIFVFAGFVDKAENWVAFVKNWSDCLKESPSIQYFKMDEAASLSGQFTNWKMDARDAKLRALFEVVREHSKRGDICRAMYFTTPFAAFHQKLTDDLPARTKRYSSAYLIGSIFLMNAIDAEIKDRGLRDDLVEVIFDKHDIFSKRMEVIYPLLCQFAEKHYGMKYPPSPTYRDDREFVPLQLADMLAWSLRRMYNGHDSTFQWILDELPSLIPISPRSVMLCERNMDILLASERVPLPLELTEESVREWGQKTGVEVDDLLISEQWRQANE